MHIVMRLEDAFAMPGGLPSLIALCIAAHATKTVPMQQVTMTHVGAMDQLSMTVSTA